MSKTAILLTAMIVLVACDTASHDHLTPGLGDAVRNNMAAQIINPDPQYPPDETPAMNGRRAGGALERYETGKVLKPNPPPAAAILVPYSTSPQ